MKEDRPDNDWVSLAQGSRDLGYSRTYLNYRIKENDLEAEMLERGMLLKLGHAKFINSKGKQFIKESVRKYAKKLGVHANITTDCVDLYLKPTPLSTICPA